MKWNPSYTSSWQKLESINYSTSTWAVSLPTCLYQTAKLILTYWSCTIPRWCSTRPFFIEMSTQIRLLAASTVWHWFFSSKHCLFRHQTGRACGIPTIRIASEQCSIAWSCSLIAALLLWWKSKQYIQGQYALSVTTQNNCMWEAIAWLSNGHQRCQSSSGR